METFEREGVLRQWALDIRFMDSAVIGSILIYILSSYKQQQDSDEPSQSFAVTNLIL